MSCSVVTSALLVILGLYFLTIGGNATPIPKPVAKPDPVASPQLQIPGSRQEFAMYKQLALHYPVNVYQQQQPVQIPSGVPYRQDVNGNPLLPIFRYSYNITHPPRPGIVLNQNQIQQLTQQRGPQQLQTIAEIQTQQQQQNQNYAPVVIADPNVIRQQQQQQFQQQQFQRQQLRNLQQPQQILLQPQNLFQNSSVLLAGQTTAQFSIPNDLREREPENDQISLRLSQRTKNIQTGSIVFDDGRPRQQFLNRVSQQSPENIVFSSGDQNQLQFPTSRPYSSSIQFNQNNGFGPTTRPTIQVPYVTTPSALQQIKQQQKNSQIAVAGFRSQLGLVNPESLQATSLSNINRNAALNFNPGVRTARVQNILVPNGGQTPAGTQLLQPQQNTLGFQSGLQNLQNTVAANAYSIQRTQNPFNQFNPANFNVLGGITITPENQRDVGQYIFTDPNNPSNINNPITASSAQKLFILPPADGSSTTSSEYSDDTPSEIVITVVDEDNQYISSQDTNSNTGERGRVLTNFSLFLIPSTYKKCVQGYRKAHDGKCRLIIKLRNTNRVQG